MKVYADLPLNWPQSLRFALAVVLFVLGLLARFAIAPQEGGLAFVTFYPVILLSFFLVGTGPGILTAILSGLAGQYFFIAPYRAFPVDAGSYRSLAVFTLTASLIGWAIARLHGYAHSLRATLDQYREAQQDLRIKSAAIEASPSGIAVLDLQGCLSYANVSFARLWGIQPSEAIGRTMVDGWLPEVTSVGTRDGGWKVVYKDGSDFPAEAGPASISLREGSTQRDVAIGIRHPSGHSTWASVSSVPILMNTKPIGIVLTSQDITERRGRDEELEAYRGHLEDLVELRTQELARARTAAEAANVAKSAFLTNMSHEIRTPMNGVLGMASLLRRTGVTGEQQEYLDKIETSGRYLLGIVEDILDLSKIEAGKLHLDLHDFESGELVRDVTAIIADRAAAKGLRLRVDMTGAPQRLHGDSGRLTQALVNYLSNAVKFTEQGSVGLSCRVLEESETSYLLRFEVSDTGIGMTADEQARIFEPFEQTDKSATRRYQGSGLGLAIAKRIASLMSGEVGVESEPGKGSLFWLTVRLDKGAPRPVAPRAPSQEGAEAILIRDFRGARVLLAEDDPISREVAQYLLQSVGLQVELAENGAEAVDKVAASDFDLILTDMQMPRMDGLQAAAAIRALPGRQTTPVLAITANAFDEHRRKCIEAGMNDFIVKPFETKRLFDTVLKWLSKRG